MFVLDQKIDSVLQELEKQEKFELENPDAVPGRQKMLAITRDIGIFYNILLRNNKARKILEIGTSTGYSTIWFAEALREQAGAKIITIEQEEGKIQRAKENFQKTGVESIIEIRKGLAIDVLKQIVKETTEPFDFVFIDADKEKCVEYFDLALKIVKTGGIIGIDNILKPERFSTYMIPFVNHVKIIPNVRSVVIPIDNGELLCTKLSESFKDENSLNLTEDEIIAHFNEQKMGEVLRMSKKTQIYGENLSLLE